MEHEKYINYFTYPTKEYITYVYKDGKVLHTFTTSMEFQNFITENRSRRGGIPPHERVWVNKEQYEQDQAEYRREDMRLNRLFKEDLEKEYGVSEDNPKKDMLYRIAYERGHSSGFGEIENNYSDMVELIQ